MISNFVPCKTIIERHATDRRIERGISLEELHEGLIKGKVHKSKILGSNKRKDFIRYSIYEIVCICIPCHRYVKTIYVP